MGASNTDDAPSSRWPKQPDSKMSNSHPFSAKSSRGLRPSAVFGRIVVLVVLLAGCAMTGPILAAPFQNDSLLSLSQILEWFRQGVSEEVIAARIKENNRPFPLRDRERSELVRRGVPEILIELLDDPGLPYPPPLVYPPDDYAKDVPGSAGVYLLDDGDLEAVPIQRLIIDDGGGILGLIGGSRRGRLTGPRARARAPREGAVFYMRLDEMTLQNLTLLPLRGESDVRRLVFESVEDGNPRLRSEEVLEFDPPVLVGPGLYRVTLGDLEPGEYVFYLPGSADPDTSIYGRGYDFGVDTDQ